MGKLCLFLAESPFDPGRRRGPLDQATPAHLIDTDQAWPACNAALEAGADAPSVRFSAARVLDAMARSGRDPALAERAKTMLVALRDEKFVLAEPALALRYFGLPGQERDIPAAERALQASADKGNAVSAYWLGRGIRQNWFKDRNAGEAERYLRQAIDGGVVEAYSELGRLALASGGEDGAAEALALFAAGAEAGDPQSSLQLGLAQYRAKTYKSAFEHIKDAAEAGVPHALYMEGFMRLYGQGTPRADYSARKAFERAIRFGHTASKAELGMMLCTDRAGSPSEKKRAEGVAMLKEAEEVGVKSAEPYLKKCK